MLTLAEACHVEFKRSLSIYFRAAGPRGTRSPRGIWM